jgi:hypothetical protein
MGTKLALTSFMKTYASVIGLLFLWGCPTTPPSSQTTIEINTSISLPVATSSLIVTEAFFSVKELELISDVDIKGQKIDGEQIISSQTNNVFSFLDAPPALYSRLQIKLNKPNSNTQLPFEFQGERLSLLLEGVAQIADGQRVPFRIQNEKPIKSINLVLSQGLDLLPGDTAQISILGDIGQLFTDVSFAAIQPADLTSGTLLLKLEDEPFLKSHPTTRKISDQLTENIKKTFNALSE